ncbi:MAG: gamma-glutamylcyclotransferase [Myxococcota bacterium]
MSVLCTMPLFVYGTLRVGSTHEHLLPGPRVAARTWGHLFHLGAGYPALVPEPIQEVRGDLAWLLEPESELRELDRYEGAEAGARDPLYVRRFWPVWAMGHWLEAYCYVMARPKALAMGGIWVEDGDWLEWKGSRAYR